MTVSQESGGGLFPLPAQSVCGTLSPREGAVAVGGGRNGGGKEDVVFYFWQRCFNFSCVGKVVVMDAKA